MYLEWIKLENFLKEASREKKHGKAHTEMARGWSA